MMVTAESYESLFKRYQDVALLARAESHALWTIPSIFPNERLSSETGNAVLEHDFQSVGAWLVNRLVTKLAGALFPSNQSFFGIDADDRVKEILKSEGIKSLISIENKASARLLLNASFAKLVQALKLLVVTGDCLIYRINNHLKLYSLRNYSLRRDYQGQVQDIIIRESIDYFELPANVKSLLGTERKADEKVYVYNRVQRKLIKGNGVVTKYIWEHTQEVEGKPIQFRQVYADELCPYISVPWNLMNGDNYGRAYIEEYSGDFNKLSELSASLTAYEIDALKVLNVFDPSSNFDVDSAEEAEHGSWITGRRDSVQTYEIGDYRKIQEIGNDIEKVVMRLSQAFMIQSNQRDAERVTQYEIMMNAQEAEQVLGGVYSQLSLSLHLPLAYILLNEVAPSFIAALTSGEYKLNIRTGLAALSRAAQNQALLVAVTEIGTVVPVLKQASKKVNLERVVENILLANGVDIEAIYYTEEEMVTIAQQEAEQSQQLAMQQQMQLGGQQLQQGVEAVQQAQGQF